MKQLILLITAITLCFGLGACASSSAPEAATKKGVPPGSGGRGDSPGQHAESQNSR